MGKRKKEKGKRRERGKKGEKRENCMKTRVCNAQDVQLNPSLPSKILGQFNSVT